MKVEVVDTRPHHVPELAQNIRPEDRREVEGITSAPVLSALAASVRGSPYCKTVLVDDEVAVIFGVSPGPVPEIGCPWALATPVIHRVARRFLRESRYWILEMRDYGGYKFLRNVVDTRNRAHVKWLKWLGAKVYGGPIRTHYRRFEIRY